MIVIGEAPLCKRVGIASDPYPKGRRRVAPLRPISYALLIISKTLELALQSWRERRGCRMLGSWTCWDADRMRRTMARFYQPDLSTDLDSPFIRDGEDKLIRRSYWLDMDDRTLVIVMVNGIGANLTNDEKRAHLIDLRREHLVDKICIQEILPPEQ
jgi:hypothetical protein